ncbi:hypothetical protein [Desulfosporosinus sp.]|uniref:hypothetical protein n=1 Tax=Desulfosporosinus sp. TaxID=157907 RepID=UPI0026249A3F|nr:hypothetical protein [Desulfosporosinus sp.]
MKKLLVILLVTFFAVTTISSTAAAQPKTLYQTSSQHTITDGATLEHISRFTADGWLNIKVLRIDTTNPNIKIDTLANNQTTDQLSTILALAEENGAEFGIFPVLVLVFLTFLQKSRLQQNFLR